MLNRVMLYTVCVVLHIVIYNKESRKQWYDKVYTGPLRGGASRAIWPGPRPPRGPHHPPRSFKISRVHDNNYLL